MINYNNETKKLTLSGYEDYQEVVIKVNGIEIQSVFIHGECSITNIDIESGSIVDLILIQKTEESHKVEYGNQ